MIVGVKCIWSAEVVERRWIVLTPSFLINSPQHLIPSPPRTDYHEALFAKSAACRERANLYGAGSSMAKRVVGLYSKSRHSLSLTDLLYPVLLSTSSLCHTGTVSRDAARMWRLQKTRGPRFQDGRGAPVPNARES